MPADAVPGDGVCHTGGTNSEGERECTFRAAIEEAEASASIDTVHFNIPTSDGGYSASPVAFTLTPASGYGQIANTVTLDATTQPEFGTEGRPVIEIDGSGVGSDDNIDIESDGSTFTGFVVNRFQRPGLRISSGASNTVVVGNYFGTDVTGHDWWHLRQR